MPQTFTKRHSVIQRRSQAKLVLFHACALLRPNPGALPMSATLPKSWNYYPSGAPLQLWKLLLDFLFAGTSTDTI